ncbi:MAG: glycosyltransferase, partial [Candidatus Goldbacteria bacterium]|nr:glycosyltransferase [Candidatus Goldiibacteriota bacterium]
MNTNFDVIILTYNSENKILKLLNSLSFQVLKPKNIFLIDSSSKDKTVEIAKKYKCVVYIIDNREFDHGGTRTYAAKLSNSDFLVYLTDDVIFYDENSLKNLLEWFKD